MPIWLTNVLGRRYSRAELSVFMEQFRKSPPIPTGMLHSMYEGTGFGGHSQMQNFHDALKRATEAIAEAPSRSAQREHTLRQILAGDHWGSLYRISNESRHVESWRHLLSEAPQDLSDDSLTRSLFVKWLVSICTSSCLVAMAYSLFGFNKQTELQCDFHALYKYTIRSVDVTVQDCIIDLVAEDRMDEARALGAFKDEEINPILNKEYAAAKWLEDQIALGGFDVETVSARIGELQGKRRALAESINAAKDSYESDVKLEWPEGWLAKWIE